MAPFGLRLRENAFQVIPDISFFDGTNIFCDQNFCCKKFCVNGPKTFSAKCLFWRSCAGLHTNVECSSRIHCQNYRFQPSTTLGGGVKRVKTVFVVSFGLKKLIPSSFLEILFTFVCESQACVPHVNKAIAGITVTALIVFRINKGNKFFFIVTGGGAAPAPFFYYLIELTSY